MIKDLRVCAVFFALAMVGCAGKMTRVTNTLRFYETALRLAARPDTLSPFIGNTLGVSLELTNATSEVVSACLGVSRTIHLMAVPLQFRDGLPPIEGHVRIVDHPYCERRFSLAPGQSLTWREDITLGDIGPGLATLSTAVQVVDPKDCDQDGCYDIMLSAPSVQLSLQGEVPK